MRVKRNVTVTLEEETARKREEEGYESARWRAFARKPFLKSDARYVGRGELHHRTRLR